MSDTPPCGRACPATTTTTTPPVIGTASVNASCDSVHVVLEGYVPPVSVLLSMDGAPWLVLNGSGTFKWDAPPWDGIHHNWTAQLPNGSFISGLLNCADDTEVITTQAPTDAPTTTEVPTTTTTILQEVGEPVVPTTTTEAPSTTEAPTTTVPVTLAPATLPVTTVAHPIPTVARTFPNTGASDTVAAYGGVSFGLGAVLVLASLRKWSRAR